MLITRCPHCETAFRVQAAHLEQAEGHVRCGHCASVFDAYQELRQSLSPTIADLEGADDEPVGDLENADDNLEFSAAEVDELERALRDDEVEPNRPSPLPADDPPTVTELPEPEPEPPVAAGSNDNARLEFNLPADQWEDFFSDTIIGEDEVPAISDTGVEWVVLGEADVDVPAAEPEPVVADAAEPTSDDADLGFFDPNSDVYELTESPTSDEDAVVVAVEDEDEFDRFDVESQEGHVMDLTAVAQQAPPAVDEPDTMPSLVETLFRDLNEAPVAAAPKQTNYRYIAAALLLVLLLGGQYLHYNRHALATHASIGPWFISTYSRLGMELVPTWNLDQYQINRWVAASDTSDENSPALKITAQITNRGPQVQPYPLVQLELKDRWDETVAARVFGPSEYLSDGSEASVLRAGEHVQAELKVVDPGQDAYGFELDVCIRSNEQQLQCANDPGS